MAQNSKIEWTHHTGNLWWGCQKVHAGCDHCYAETLDKRWGGNHWGPTAPRRLIKEAYSQFHKFQKKAAAAGEIHRVFVGSMMDIFEKPFPLVTIDGTPIEGLTTGTVRDAFFHEIVPACPNLLFLLLTKRPGNIIKYIPTSWLSNPPANVIYGTSPVDQETFDDMVPKLLQVPGRHFLSIEPILGAITFRWRPYVNIEIMIGSYGKVQQYDGVRGIDWVIAGGESGHSARPPHPDWFTALRDQCKEAGIPFHFKQWGEWLPIDQPKFQNSVKELSNKEQWLNLAGGMGFHGEEVYRIKNVGKHEAGRLLDNITHDGLPA